MPKKKEEVEPELETKISWFAKNLDNLSKIVVSVLIIASLGYTSLDWLGEHFVTKAEAADYALKKNVSVMDHDLAKTQIIVLSNELYNAKKAGIEQDDKTYLRTLDKRKFMLQIKLKILDAKEEDYKIPAYLKE